MIRREVGTPKVSNHNNKLNWLETGALNLQQRFEPIQVENKRSDENQTTIPRHQICAKVINAEEKIDCIVDDNNYSDVNNICEKTNNVDPAAADEHRDVESDFTSNDFDEGSIGSIVRFVSDANSQSLLEFDISGSDR